MKLFPQRKRRRREPAGESAAERVKARPVMAEPTREKPVYFLATTDQWAFLLFAGLTVAAASWVFYTSISPWIGICVALAVIVLGHAVVVARVLPPLAHVAILFAGLQLVMMAWFAYYFPPNNPAYGLGNRVGIYLAYGAPAWIAYTIGWFLAMWGLSAIAQQTQESSRSQTTVYLCRELDILIFGGIGISLISRVFEVPGLQFAFKLAATLKFVGVIGWILLGRAGWRWRSVVAVGIEVISATGVAMFGELAMWGAAMLAAWVHRNPWGRKSVFICLVGMILVLPALEQAKWRLREKTWQGGDPRDVVLGMDVVMTRANRPIIWGLYMVEGLWKTVTFSLDENTTGGLSARHNHGWIVDAVMQQVPAIEPYAEGETVYVAIKSALLPRIFFPEKYVAGGQNFERFTGRPLEDPISGERLASMNIGFSGEFFANFGQRGGILASGIYGVICGLILRWFYQRGRTRPLWWAFYPFIFCYGLKAEEGLGEICNWLVKSVVVTAAVYWTFPSIRMALSGRVAAVGLLRGKTVRKRRQPRSLAADHLAPSAPGK